jgi:type IV secretion system protein VirB10
MTHLDPSEDLAAREAPLDRTISPISGRFAAGRTGKAIVFGGLVVGCAAFAAMSWHAGRPKAQPAPNQPARQVVAFEPAKAPPTLAAPGPGAPVLAPASPGDPTVPALDPSTGKPVSAAGLAQARAAQAARLQAIRAAPLLAFGSTSAEASGPAGSSPAMVTRAASPPLSELDQLRHGSTIGQARARRLGDRSYLILAGASIPCILQSAMDTATPGYVSCLIPRDVYSDNGAVVLLEKGTKVLGEYRSSLKAGQARLFVLWTRAVTPNGVAIDLASPASDALGRAGFDGDLDRHFWERFGGALLLSIVDDGATALAGRDRGVETARLPSDAAGIAVQHSIDIPPTLRKPQGAEVAIFAADDFDFSGVYGLQAR